MSKALEEEQECRGNAGGMQGEGMQGATSELHIICLCRFCTKEPDSKSSSVARLREP